MVTAAASGARRIALPTYDVIVGAGILDRLGDVVHDVAPAHRYAIVTDSNVGPVYASRVHNALGAERAAVFTVAAGESHKTRESWSRITDELFSARFGRDSAIVALGGGVVGDVAGFVAATFMRGVPFIQVPTTLLAMIDASVGGKTGVDTPAGKNLVGAFHQPVLVLADVATLATLPRRELLAGYAEIVKYGLIRDRAFFEWLERDGARLLAGDAATLVRAVAESCAHKAAVVSADERESGERQLLNFGHTFGHALEAETGFGPDLLHGEAVAAGMALAFDFSVRLGHATRQSADSVRRHLANAGLPTGLGALGGNERDPDRLLAHMRHDKKVSDGRLTFILAREIGDAFVARDVPDAAVRDFLAAAS